MKKIEKKQQIERNIEILTPIRDTVVAVRNSYIRSFHSTHHTSAGYDSFTFLKQAAITPTKARQTELGEFHPDFPSSHGPMTYVRVNRMGGMDRIQRQGLVPVSQAGHNTEWDGDENLFSPGEKQFDMTRGGGKGFWLTKPHPRNIKFASTGADKGGHGLVGVRMNPQETSQLDMQHRTADESPEDLPEMLVHEKISPEKLVMMPQAANVKQGVDWQDESTWGNVPKENPQLGRQFGIDENFVDRNSPPDGQGRAFNFEELGGF